MLLSIPRSAVRDFAVPSARVFLQFLWCRSSGSLLEYFYLCDFWEEPSLNDSSLCISFVCLINKCCKGTRSRGCGSGQESEMSFFLFTMKLQHVRSSLKAFRLSRKQLSLTWTSCWVRWRVVWHTRPCASGRVSSILNVNVIKTQFDMWKVWCCGGVWLRYWSCQTWSEGGGISQLRSKASDFLVAIFFFSSCRLRQTLISSEFNEENQNPKVFPFAAVTTDFSNQTIRLLSNCKNTAKRR